MSDPYRPGQSGWQGSEPTDRYPAYTDPAYAGQTPTYGAGYQSAYPPGPTEPAAQQQWGPAEPQPTGSEPPPPEPPKSPKWLWLAAGAAVLLVVGLVIALVIANGSANKSATVTPFPGTPSTKAGTRSPVPTTSGRSPTTTTEPGTGGTSPTTTSGSGAPQTVVYSVTGSGRAMSIIYTDADGVVQNEFNVPLPWSKEVTLDSSTPASVTVANIGEEVTCTITVDGAQVSQRTGSVLTVCLSNGG
ncbi:MmpS family transport accessory protein [Mycobacterium talmoniae]|uniref:Transport accessory protein MmpS3 n=1 Tax=Mycobacterium talmoniae TaxID=1858794 RepID=A0A1S1NK54_9MYCO|nr:MULTISPECIES: MmpS family transport accessory protein [Mycobacterium]OHV04245.1 hypothetical protein BKN37_10990 [Mycobacterium talmoniae]TDH56512.1 hypothetical protein E2F47_06350 [Mycobacterium eburneum]